ncbi:proteoglycan 4a [Pholidichthys leucotaenia]
MVMMKMSFGLLFVLIGMTSATANAGSCVGRCGEVFTRGQKCTCDFSCLQHKECCQDFEATCTTAQSCQGRCGETFRRGLLCECDPLCIRYSTCCHDYKQHCDATAPVSQQSSYQTRRATATGRRKSGRSGESSNSESEEYYTGRLRCPQHLGAQCQNALNLNSQTSTSSRPSHHAMLTSRLPQAASNIPVGPWPVPSSHNVASHSLASGSSRPSTPAASGGEVNVQVVLPSAGAAPSGLGQGSRPRPVQDVAQDLELSLVEVGYEGPGTGLLADADLCSDSPINGLTALINGTILIFKGEFFWSVDPISRSVGRPQRITDTLGVPAPIHTVFTRANCYGNTYIIKGNQYWRLDGNMVMQPGYPKPLTSEFPGLTGTIRAVLVAPATKSRPETVYFFKNGDILQRFTFPPSNTPSCKPMMTRTTPQAGVLLSAEIKIKVAMKGFPTPVTSALSMSIPQSSDVYQHYVFTGPLFFSVQISGDLPARTNPDQPPAFTPILSPAAAVINSANAATQPNHPQPANSIRVWLHCP